ncbi:MAG TPA: sulfatase-like hydrolase/transferase [Actinopolymorphaceae bacterium]
MSSVLGPTGPTPHDVIVIMTDQHRADLCAREGFPVDCTPTLDQLASGGRWFNRAYTTAPVCVPARISMLTGRYPSAHGVRENYGYADPHYSRDLFDLAREAGMRTAMIGKNHSHLTSDRVDEWYEFGHLGAKRLGGLGDGRGTSHGRAISPTSAAFASPREESAMAREFDGWLRRLGANTATDATPYPVSVQIPARIVDRAIAWLDADTSTRSLLWLSIPEPHVPYQVPEPYFSEYSPRVVPPPATDSQHRPNDSPAWQVVADLAVRTGEADPQVLARARANYVGMLRLIDDQITRLVRHLAAHGRLSRTLIVFVADHGDFVGEYGLMRKGPGLPEVLARVPMFFYGPQVTASSSPSHAHVSIVDILPTLCELLGWPLPEGVQGRSLAPILWGEPYPEREFDSAYVEQGYGGLPYTLEELAALPPRGAKRGGADTLSEGTQSGSLRMVRAGRWKLVADALGRFSLFDLKTDPYELDNRYGRPGHEEISRTMLERLAAWLVRTADPLPIPPDGYVRKLHPRNYQWHEA